MNQAVRQQPSRLARVVRGRIEKPIKLVLYGTDGLGKSTFASNAPAPIFIGSEDGTSQLDVARMPDIRAWTDILECADELAGAEHEYKTVVLDTADWAEPMCWAYVAAKAKKPDIESLPYGKGYVAALDQWRVLLSKFERLIHSRDMNVIILAHVWIKTFKAPDSDDFDRYEMKLHPKAAGLLREWSDATLFGAYETFTDSSGGRAKGISTGARVIHTQRAAAYDAKNRYDLPPTIPLDWQAFHDATKAHRPASPEQLTARIEKLLEAADDVLRARVRAAVQKASSDAAQLAKIHNHLSAQMQIAAQENAR